MTQETLISSGTPTSMMSGVMEQSENTATIRRGDLLPPSIPLEVTGPIPVAPPVPPVPVPVPIPVPIPVPLEPPAKDDPPANDKPGVYTVKEEDEEAEENTEM